MNYIVWLQEITFDSHRLIFKKIAYWIKVNINFTLIFRKYHKTLLINDIHQIIIFTYILSEYESIKQEINPAPLLIYKFLKQMSIFI